MKDWLAAKQWYLATSIFFAACGFLAAGKLDGSQWVGLMQWLATVYIAGEVGSRMAEKKTND